MRMELKIVSADEKWTETVCDITHRTIRDIYPLYYRAAEVDFFLKHHACDKIRLDVDHGDVYLCFNQAFRAVGTVTVKGNSICRLFVLPEHQGKGYGGVLLHYAEERIFSRNDCAVLDTSLPGKPIYLKKGYSVTESKEILMDDGKVLRYEVMTKLRQQIRETQEHDALNTKKSDH